MDLIIDSNTLLYLVAIGWATLFSFLAIRTRDILYSAVFLVGMYVASAWALIQIGAWFLALIYLFVNAGGVLVLIIFAAMLTRPTIDIPPTKELSRVAFINALLIVALIASMILISKSEIYTSFSSNLSLIIKLLFNDYGITLFIFSLAALAIYLGAIYIASEEK